MIRPRRTPDLNRLKSAWWTFKSTHYATVRVKNRHFSFPSEKCRFCTDCPTRTELGIGPKKHREKNAPVQGCLFIITILDNAGGFLLRPRRRPGVGPHPSWVIIFSPSEFLDIGSGDGNDSYWTWTAGVDGCVAALNRVLFRGHGGRGSAALGHVTSATPTAHCSSYYDYVSSFCHENWLSELCTACFGGGATRGGPSRPPHDRILWKRETSPESIWSSPFFTKPPQILRRSDIRKKIDNWF